MIARKSDWPARSPQIRRAGHSFSVIRMRNNGSASPVFPSLMPKNILPTAPPPLSGGSRSSSPAMNPSPSSGHRRPAPSENAAVALSGRAAAPPSSMPSGGRPTTSPPLRGRSRAEHTTPRETEAAVMQRPLARVQATCRKGVLHSSAGLVDGPGGAQVPRGAALQPAPGEPDAGVAEALLTALRQQPPFDMVGDATLTALVTPNLTRTPAPTLALFPAPSPRPSPSPSFSPTPNQVASMRMRELAAGELLVEEGQLGSVCYVVAKGELAVVSGGVPVDSVKGGDVFGESAMIYDVRRLARVRVRVRVRIRVPQSAR